jgi:hypothetical protein
LQTFVIFIRSRLSKDQFIAGIFDNEKKPAA